MFKFLKKLFTPEEPHVPEGLIDTKYNSINHVKNIIATLRQLGREDLVIKIQFRTPPK